MLFLYLNYDENLQYMHQHEYNLHKFNLIMPAKIFEKWT